MITIATTEPEKNRWPFRLHAAYDETITRVLNVYEEMNREEPPNGLHWYIDHVERISPRNMERIRALGDGIAIQRRMAFQNEYSGALRGGFVEVLFCV